MLQIQLTFLCVQGHPAGVSVVHGDHKPTGAKYSLTSSDSVLFEHVWRRNHIVSRHVRGGEFATCMLSTCFVSQAG